MVEDSGTGGVDAYDPNSGSTKKIHCSRDKDIINNISLVVGVHQRAMVLTLGCHSVSG